MRSYRDYYFNKAKQDTYPARSIYKLKELDTHYQFLVLGQKVLDLGAAPGSWTLYAADKVARGKTVGRTGIRGQILAVDIQDWAILRTIFPNNVTCLTEDVLKPSSAFITVLDAWRPFDVILSDMAPYTTGIRVTDQVRSLALAEAALGLAYYALAVGGYFVVKVFMGPNVKAFAEIMRRQFATVKAYKPKSSRSESVEVFYVGLGFKGQLRPLEFVP